MRPETPDYMPHRPDQSDCHEVLGAIFGLMCPDAGHIEWLLDWIEGTSGGPTWV